ncbi:hypothetical protein QUA82_05380 [Microcoleus sp. F8-D3]
MKWLTDSVLESLEQANSNIEVSAIAPNSEANQQINESGETASCGCNGATNTVTSVKAKDSPTEAIVYDPLTGETIRSLQIPDSISSGVQSLQIGSASSNGLSYLLDNTANNFTLTPGFLNSYTKGLFALDGADTVIGSVGSDLINGNQGNDNLSGGQGNDTIFGGKGADLIDGGDGDDVLYGDFETDTLTGGAGQDMFILPSGSAAIAPSAADLIADFNKDDDFIGLTDGLTEAGVTLEAASIVPGSSDTVIKNSATGAILGRVAGVSPTDVQGRLVKANIVTYDTPTARQISADTYEMILAGSDGSQFVSTIKKTDTQVYQESVRYTPSNQGNSSLQPFTVRYNPEGTRAELQQAGSSNSVILQRIENNSASVIEKSPTGETEVGRIGDLGTDFAKGLALQISCIFGKGFCEAVDKTSDIVGKWKDGAEKAGSEFDKFGLPVNGSSSAIEEFEAISQVSGVFCKSLFSNDEELKKLVEGAVEEAVEGAIEDTISLPEKPTGFFKIGDSVQNLFSGINKFFFEGKGELSSNLRKELGINACDPQSPTVPPPQSPITSPPPPSTASLKIKIEPSAIPYLGTANLNVKYSNPDNDSRIVEITGTGQKGLGSTSFLIPEDKKGQGELNFTLTNRGRELGGPGSESLDNFLDVGIGNGRGGGLFANDYKQLSFDLLGAPNPLDFLPNVYTLTSVEGLTRR